MPWCFVEYQTLMVQQSHTWHKKDGLKGGSGPLTRPDEPVGIGTTPANGSNTTYLQNRYVSKFRMSYFKPGIWSCSKSQSDKLNRFTVLKFWSAWNPLNSVELSKKMGGFSIRSAPVWILDAGKMLRDIFFRISRTYVGAEVTYDTENTIWTALWCVQTNRSETKPPPPATRDRPFYGFNLSQNCKFLTSSHALDSD